MPLHRVRFDDETEEALVQVCQATGQSASEVLKEGVLALRERLTQARTRKAFDLYQTLDLGPGGYSKAPARRAKEDVAATVRLKHCS